jgi:hypothetical protein
VQGKGGLQGIEHNCCISLASAAWRASAVLLASKPRAQPGRTHDVSVARFDANATDWPANRTH